MNSLVERKADPEVETAHATSCYQLSVSEMDGLREADLEDLGLGWCMKAVVLLGGCAVSLVSNDSRWYAPGEARRTSGQRRRRTGEVVEC
jgi:hypothetical protein